MIGARLGHFRILEKIGEGGMGVVYRAQDEHLDCHVVVKVLTGGALADEATRKRFRTEALALARLNHPNIAVVHDFDTQKGCDFLVMEYIPGSTLRDRLFPLEGSAEGPLPEEQIANLAVQLAEGLAAAHEAGVIHRDLKPGNLRITPDGRLKILDFGLALLAKPAGDSSMTCSDSKLEGIAGTISYLAPEQLHGTAANAGTDIYSVGIILLQMATAQPPGICDNTQLQRASPELQRIIQKCLERDPDLRYASARDLLADLQQLRAGVKAAHSIAVTYFENLGGAQEEAYFRDGITEDIITELCKVRILSVFPRSTVAPFRDRDVSAREIGRRLGAAYVLTGSVRRADRRLRITTQLVDANSGHSMWAERYDREWKDVFDVQDDISRQIAQALRIQLSPQEQEALASKPTKDPEAYDFYLRGRSLARRCTRMDLDAGIHHYERAIAHDPTFALAFSGIAIACCLIFEWHDKDPRWLDRAEAAANRSLELEPELAEGLAAQAKLAWAQKNYELSAQLARRAIEQKSNCEHAYWILGQSYFTLDRLEELARLAEQTMELSGADYNVYVPLYLTMERLGRLDASPRIRERQTTVLEQHLQQVPEDVRARILVAGNYATFGQEGQAIFQVQTAAALRPNDSNILYNAACTFAILQHRQEALEMLRRAKKAGFAQFDYAARDTDLRFLHDDPEFQALVSAACQERSAS